jgi:aerobic carbon-monoxide dehydrogenase large subunit
MRPMKFGMGQPVRRVEDQRLTTGTGRYTDDTAVEGALHAYVLRSPHAHAKFRIVDKQTALKRKGVKLVLTGEDVAHLGDIPCKGLIQDIDGKEVKPNPVPVLPVDTVRHVGEAIAFIVAETLDQARDAAEAIEIEFETLPSITGIAEALEAMSPSKRSRAIARRPRRPSPRRTGRSRSPSSTTASPPTTWRRVPASPNTTRRPSAGP